MKEASSTAVIQTPFAEAHKQLSARKIQLKWLKGAPGTNEEERELDEYLNENADYVEVPPVTMECVGDPRTQEPEEFRDIIRLQYNCEELKMQISRLRIKIKPDRVDDDTPGILTFDLIDRDWKKVCSVIESMHLAPLTGEVRIWI